MRDKSNDVIKVYDNIAEKYSQAFDKDFPDKSFMDKFLSFLNKNSKILDVGCGTGRALGYYLDKGFEVIGLDASKEMLNIAKKKFPNVRFMLKDMRDINFNLSSFDAVSFSYSLFHINKREVPLVLEKVNKILKPNGVILLVLQEGDGEINIDEPFNPAMKIYFNLYTEQQMTLLLKEKGFEVLFKGRISPEELEIPYNKLFLIAKKV